jgi:hypothetical protein
VPARHVMLRWAPRERCSGRSPGTDVGASLRLRTSPGRRRRDSARWGPLIALEPPRPLPCRWPAARSLPGGEQHAACREGLTPARPAQGLGRIPTKICTRTPAGMADRAASAAQHATCSMRAAAMRAAAMRAAACHNKSRERRCPAPARLARLSQHGEYSEYHPLVLGVPSVSTQTTPAPGRQPALARTWSPPRIGG